MNSLRVSKLNVGPAELLHIHDPSLPVARFIIAFRGGAGEDRPGAAGTTRCLMELILRGTETSDRQDFNARLERTGSNIYPITSRETSALRGTCLARYFDQTFDLAAEALSRPRLDGAELGELKEELADGLRAERDDDSSLASLFLRRALFSGTAHARSSGGEVSELAAVTLDAISRRRRGLFAAERLVVAIAGDISEAQSAAALRRIVDTLNSPGPMPESPLEPLVLGAPRLLVVDKPDREQIELRVAFPGPRWREPDARAFYLAVTAFAGTFSSPFSHQIREERGWSYTADVSYARLSRTSPPVVFRCSPSREQAADCVALQLGLFADASTLSDAALDRAAAYLENRAPLDVASSADLLLPVLRSHLIGESPEAPWHLVEELREVSRDTARASLAKRLSAPPCCVAVGGGEALARQLENCFKQATIRVVDHQSDDLDPFRAC